MTSHLVPFTSGRVLDVCNAHNCTGVFYSFAIYIYHCIPMTCFWLMLMVISFVTLVLCNSNLSINCWSGLTICFSNGYFWYPSERNLLSYKFLWDLRLSLGCSTCLFYGSGIDALLSVFVLSGPAHHYLPLIVVVRLSMDDVDSFGRITLGRGRMMISYLRR